MDHALITPVPSEKMGWLTAGCIFVFMAFFAMGPYVCGWLALSFLADIQFPALAQSVKETPAQHNARMEGWRDARFGMFIHWGVYSVPAGAVGQQNWQFVCWQSAEFESPGSSALS